MPTSVKQIVKSIILSIKELARTYHKIEFKNVVISTPCYLNRL